MAHNVHALTEKEKQTLRLLLAGHDAKSMARALGLSVHTINDRLRMTRRKLSVTSSREAARLLLDRFYRELVRGTTIGQAVAEARKALKQRSPVARIASLHSLQFSA